MFNNPFASFHDMIAKAKEEREQLDSLLTISTPHERLLVAAIAVLLLLLAAWLLFGSLDRSIAFNGILVEQVETLPADSRLAQALVWIQADTARSVKTGMPVMVELDTKDAKGGTLDGAVRAISAMLSEGTSALPPVESLALHRVDIALEEGLVPDSLASRECRLVIGLGRQSPIELFLNKRL